ncbi:hypothetical protein Tco_0915657 [Tanacetum coccineum]
MVALDHYRDALSVIYLIFINSSNFEILTILDIAYHAILTVLDIVYHAILTVLDIVYHAIQNMYALSITKTKAARYKDEGIEEMIPSLWSLSNIGFKSRYEVYSNLNIKSIQRNKVLKKFGHDPAKIQNKVRNMKGMEEFDLINALRMYIRRIVIMKRVLCLKVLTPEKRLIRDNEFYKFSYGTLNKVLNKLKVIVRNKLGYRNERMEQYYWTKDDEKKTTKFIKKKINKMLKERRRFTRLELFVGGRRDKTDYRLLVRPE